jgi:hypothetical protein
VAQYQQVGACEWVGLRDSRLLAVVRTSSTPLSSPDGVEMRTALQSSACPPVGNTFQMILHLWCWPRILWLE